MSLYCAEKNIFTKLNKINIAKVLSKKIPAIDLNTGEVASFLYMRTYNKLYNKKNKKLFIVFCSIMY